MEFLKLYNFQQRISILPDAELSGATNNVLENEDGNQTDKKVDSENEDTEVLFARLLGNNEFDESKIGKLKIKMKYKIKYFF